MKSNRIVTFAVALASAGCGAPNVEPLATERQAFPVCGDACSSWVYPSAFLHRSLIYVPDAEGDRIADFSRIGFKQGRHGLLSDTLPSMGAYTLRNDAILEGTPSTLPPLVEDVNEVCALENGNPKYDHGPWIQAALNQVKDQDAVGNVHGRVYLSRGHYALWSRLNVPDGVVLRGVSETASSTDPATTLHACGRAATALITLGSSPDWTVAAGTTIQDEIVPSGSNSVRVPTSQAGGFVAGSRVRIVRPSPQAWINEIGMDGLWNPGTEDLLFDRTITHVETVDGVTNSKRLFFDQPLTNALESKYGTASIRSLVRPPLDPTVALGNAGVYRLRAESHATLPSCPRDFTLHCNDVPISDLDPNLGCDEEDNVICPNPAHTASCKDSSGNLADDDRKYRFPYCRHSEVMVSMPQTEDAWVKEIVAVGFSQSAVAVGEWSSRVTIEDVVYTDPVGPDRGGWRYPFDVSGQATLVIHAGARQGRHDYVPGARATGPIAFVESDSVESQQDSGPHQHWANGVLFDNLNLTSDDCHPASGTIQIRNRATSGNSNHGWTGSSMVTWNTTVDRFRYFSPPTGQNWLLGSTGELGPPNNWEGGDCMTHEDPVFDAELMESEPHYDFGSSSSHGVPRGPLSSIPEHASSLYRSAAEVWTAYPNGVEQREYFVGDTDDFGNATGGDTNDAVFVNPAFRAFVAQSLPTRGFDSTDDHKNIPVTFRFDLAQGDTIVHAYLAVRIKRVGAWNTNSDHKVQIASADRDGNGFTDDLTTYFYVSMPEAIEGPIDFSVNQDPVVRVIDLTPQLSSMATKITTDATGRRYGELNVNFFRRTRVDWAALTLWVRHP